MVAASLRYARFVALTTFGETGEPVSTRVRIARDGDELLVLARRDSGEVERLRRDPRVELRPCDRSGAVSPEAVAVRGAALLVDDPGPARQAVTARHPVEQRVVLASERVVQVLQRRPRTERLTVRIRTGL